MAVADLAGAGNDLGARHASTVIIAELLGLEPERRALFLPVAADDVAEKEVP